MDVRFANAGLARCAREEAEAIARWGTDVGTRYTYVINFLACIDAVGDLGKFAFLDAVERSTSDQLRWTVRVTDGWRLALEAVEGEQALVVVEVVRNDRFPNTGDV